MGWKLVRDRNEEWCRANGVSGAWREAGKDEVTRALARKLIEEACEFAENLDPAELFDLGDALDELLRVMAPSEAAVGAHNTKTAVHGRFRQHVMWSAYPKEAVPFTASRHTASRMNRGLTDG